MALIDAAIESPQFRIFANGGPGALNQLVAQTTVARARNRAAIFLSPVECSLETRPRKPAIWRTLVISRQSPRRAIRCVATIQPMPGRLVRKLMDCRSSGSFWQKRRICFWTAAAD